MKTRIIHTKFWEDSYIADLTVTEKLLFLYFLTNSHVNIIWTYECSDRIIKFETGVDDATLQKTKEKFMKDRKILFRDDYVYLVNANRYETFKGEKNQIASEKLEEQIGDEVIDWFKAVLDTPIDTLIDTVPIGTINHKSEIISHKSEIRPEANRSKWKQKEAELKSMKQELKTFIQKINQLRGTKYKYRESLIGNYMEHRKVHSAEEMLNALDNARHMWFANDYSPELVLRTRNKNGACDYIEDMLNYKDSIGNRRFESESSEQYKDLF